VRAFPRRGLAVATTVVCALILVVPSVGSAQDETDDPFDTPSPLCGVLTPEEASAALGVTLTVGSSSETDCSYDADPNESDVSLITQREEGPLTDDYPRLYYPDGIDLEVAGRPAFYDAESTTLFVDEGATQQLLVLQLFGALPEDPCAPEGQPSSSQAQATETADPSASVAPCIDVQAALESLAVVGLPRLASIPVPVEPSAAPEPSYLGDAELAALMPTEVDGSTVYTETFAASDILSDIDTTDTEIADSVRQLQEALATLGRTTDDLSIADGSYATEDGSGTIQAVRVKGADVGPIAEELVSLLLIDLTGAVRTPATVGGKAVTIISDEPLDASPDPSADPFDTSSDRAYLYPKGEIVWFVVADEPGLTSVFEQLP
jgi:hypothetical protein